MRVVRQPLKVMPPVYQLFFWNWCRLNEVCDIVPDLAATAGNEFRPGPDDLVRRFAALVRLNRLPEDAAKNAPRKKIFRYSVDGSSFAGTEVLSDLGLREKNVFRLDIASPYPPGLFVPVGWVQDTLSAIRLGSVQAVQAGSHIIGFGPSGRGERLIHLVGPEGMFLIRNPAGVGE